MIQDATFREVLAEFKTGLKKLYGSRLKGLYCFGSYARGEQHKDSDLDILIVLDGFDRFALEIDRTGHLAADLSLKYDIAINRTFVTENDWEKRNSSFLVNVREDAIAA